MVPRPAAAEGLDKLDAGNEALAGELGADALGGEGGTVGVDDVEVAGDAGFVTLAREIGGALGTFDGPFLGGGLVREETNAGEIVFDFRKRD